MAAPLAILGSHVFAEEVADLVTQTGEYEIAAFVENWDRERAGRTLAGRRVIWVDELAEHAGEWSAVCAIGSPERRAFEREASGVAEASERTPVQVGAQPVGSVLDQRQPVTVASLARAGMSQATPA